MKFKRFATMALAGAMSLSLAVPAFAQSTEVTAIYSSPTIEVTVPTKGAVVINPFGLDVQMSEDPTAADQSTVNKVTISGQKIVTAPMALKNKTKMNLGVNVTLTGTIATNSDLRLAAEPLAADDTSKSAFVYLQAASAPSDLVGDASTVTTAAVAAKFAEWEPTAYSADNDLILGTRAASKENVATLKAAKMKADGTFDEYKAGSIAFVRLAGDCVASPRSAWASADGFTATIAYTFAPVQLPTYDITAGTMSHSSPATADPEVASIKVETKEVTKAAAGDTVTVEVTVDSNQDNINWTVVDAENNAIDGLTGTVAKDGSTTTRTFTFTMPEKAVKINVAAN